MKRKWIPVTAGILEILLGISGCIVAYFVFVISKLQGGYNPVFTGISALIVLILSILAITGGIYAVRRKSWSIALIGSVASVAPSLPYALTFLPSFSRHLSLSANSLLGLSWIIAVIPILLVLLAREQFTRS